MGYFFGRQLHQTLRVPVGLIDNAWGGSACEAWVNRELLEADKQYAPLLAYWDGDSPGRRAPNHWPGRLYNGILNPLIGYGLRGAIWYQGEANGTRGYQYRQLFPLMIQNWRDAWGQGDFPFYWVQLADYRDEVEQPSGSDWAELREAQTMTLDRLPNTGEAVIFGARRSARHPSQEQTGCRQTTGSLGTGPGLRVGRGP